MVRVQRWKAIVSYKPDHMEDVTILFDEFDELGQEIELGPDWNHIDAITVLLNAN